MKKIGLILSAMALGVHLTNARPDETNKVRVVNGVVMPKRPLTNAIADAMLFLRKADGGYKPGSINGELAGYFTSALVNPDGTPSGREMAYPARQHAYFIFTFLRYGKYSGEKEWLPRARDLADWNLAHSTPATAVYSNLPYSTWRDGKAGGGADGDAIEPDKAAFLGSAYLALYDATQDKKYLTAAKAIGDTLIATQRPDGGWPFRVVAQDGTVREEFGGALVFYVEFFEDLVRHAQNVRYSKARDAALALMLDRHVKKQLWGTYHEDVKPKDPKYLSAEPMAFTANYLFQNAKAHPEYVAMGKTVLSQLESRLVYTNGHAASPAPAVSEQAGFDHIMPGHTARYCLALASLAKDTGDPEVKQRLMSALNALTYMQSDAGLFRTFFFSVKDTKPGRVKPDWYSQHLYTVCHVLEIMEMMPEVANGGSSKDQAPRTR